MTIRSRMTKKPILKNPKLVLILGSWYLLTGIFEAFSFLMSLLIAIVLPAVGELVPLYILFFGGIFIALKLWGAWRYIHLDNTGWIILLALEGWGVLKIIAYYLNFGFGLPVPGDAGAEAIFGVIQFFAILFLLTKLSILLYTRKYFDVDLSKLMTGAKK